MPDEYTKMGNEAAALTQDQQTLGASANIPAGQTGSPWTAPPVPLSTTANIPIAQVKPTQALDLPQATQGPDTASALVTNAATGAKGLDAYIKELTPNETALDKTQSTLISKINELIPQVGGKTQALGQEQQNQGVPLLKKQLTDLQNQIITRSAEYDKMINDVKANSNFKGSFSAKENELRATKASEVGLLAARAQATVGNLQTALDLASDAVNAKYAPIEDELKIRESQLNVIQPLLNKQEKQQALAQQLKIQDDQQRVQEEKAKAKENIGMAFSANIQTQFANKGGEWFRVSDGKTYSDPAQLFKDANVSSFDQLYQRGMVTDLTAERLENIDFISQLRAKYPDAGITINDSVDAATQKLNGSRIYQEQVRPPVRASSGSGGGGGRSGGGMGSVAGGIVNADGTTTIVNPTDQRVLEIIAENPNDPLYRKGWGSAADAIDAEFGAGTATKYDPWLKSVYQDGQSVDSLQPRSENLNDLQLIARAIINGDQPPVLTGLYGKTAAVKAELERKGYNLTEATQDWKATEKYLGTLNGAQQVRLRQAVSFTKDSLDIVEGLNNEWQGGKYPVLNKANLIAAKNGALGQNAQSIATRIDAQIADLVSELATVYKGGNSSTDESLKLAAKSLSGEYSYKQLQDSVNLIRQNLQVRENSLRNTGVAGVGENAYEPGGNTNNDPLGLGL